METQMPILRLKQSGFETFTGNLHQIAFVDGVSVLNVSSQIADRIAASMKVEDFDTPNVQIGEAACSTRRALMPSPPVSLVCVPVYH